MKQLTVKEYSTLLILSNVIQNLWLSENLNFNNKRHQRIINKNATDLIDAGFGKSDLIEFDYLVFKLEHKLDEMQLSLFYRAEICSYIMLSIIKDYTVFNAKIKAKFKLIADSNKKIIRSKKGRLNVPEMFITDTVLFVNQLIKCKFETADGQKC